MMLLTLLVSCLTINALLACDANSNCTGDCRCMSGDIPGGLEVTQTPQFVMLTFDDAVTSANFHPTYEELFTSNYSNPSGCNIGATFFVSHEYNNYAELHHLWRAGSEIAVHTITHETSTEMWKKADYNRWKSEAVGMRKIISKFAAIPESEIQGFRAPFLQTAGDTTFEVLMKEGFTYDSSLATRSFAGEDDESRPIWPFTFDYPFEMDCIIRPCPESVFPGLWEVPLVSYFRLREVITGRPPVKMPCAMADACVPWPTTEDDTYEYFMDNFKRHYERNKAPFPVFLHESWLKDPQRKKGYLKFFSELMDMDDVFVVTVQEVIDFIREPQPLDQYREKRCITANTKVPAKCSNIGKYCYFEETDLGGSRTFFPCVGVCPKKYPWLNIPL